MSSVLVLNQDFSPLTLSSVERAFLLIYLEKAEMLDVLHGKVLRTVSNSYPCPSVIRILDYKKIPYKGVVLTRHNLFKRDGFQCQYCGTSSNLTLDHVQPKSRGGKRSSKGNVRFMFVIPHRRLGIYVWDHIVLDRLSSPTEIRQSVLYLISIVN